MANQTMDEAARAAAESARATLQGITRASRDALAEGARLNRRLVDAWLSSSEASLKAGFELQNLAIQAGISFMEAGSRSMQIAATEWAEVVKQGQQTTVQTWGAARQAAETIQERAGNGKVAN